MSIRDSRAVRDLPRDARDTFTKCYDAAVGELGDERAGHVAWGAVQNHYKQDDKGRWSAKTDDERATVDSMFMERMEFDFADATNVRETKNGYLVCTPRFARIGIQKYRGYELGMPELDEVAIYRSEDEVFHKDSLASWAHAPITNGHPPEFVTADNYVKYARGHAADEIARDGEFIRIPLAVMDAATVKDAKQGKKQLSGGYAAQIIWGAGKTPKGEHYDARQVNIRGNHIAICQEARGGPMLCLGDSFSPPSNDKRPSPKPNPNDPTHRKEKSKMRTLTVDSIGVNIEDDTHAGVVQRALADRDGKITTMTADIATLTKAGTDKDAQIKTLSDQVATLTGEKKALEQKVSDAQLKPEQIDQLVADRVDMLGRARFVLGDSFDPRGKTSIEIMRAVVQQKMGDSAKTMGDGELKGAFNVMTSDYKPGASANNGGGGGNFGGGGNGGGLYDMSRAFGGQHSPMNDSQRAWSDSAKRDSEAWQYPNGRPAERQQ